MLTAAEESTNPSLMSFTQLPSRDVPWRSRKRVGEEDAPHIRTQIPPNICISEQRGALSCTSVGTQ